MKSVDIIERIEGEARLRLEMKNKIISKAQIEFMNFRGFEFILEGKEVLDALVYTPRICGICGQAHLLATVKALENLYADQNIKLEITKKAEILRQVALNIEIIDSHIKWFYMFIMPDISALSKNKKDEYTVLKGKKWFKAQKVTSEFVKSLALIAGQWPHSSFMIPGGVMCDPTLFDIISIKSHMDSLIMFFENDLSGMSLDNYLSLNSYKEINYISNDLKDFINFSNELELEKIGKSYDNHISFSSDNIFSQGKILNNLSKKISIDEINETIQNTFTIENKSKKAYTWAKTLRYKNNFFETGPLSRALISKFPFISSLHEEYDDSVFTRVMARISEVAVLINSSKELLNQLDISQDSFIKPKISLKEFNNAKASASIEAARGSLVHEIKIKDGIIHKYNVITPTLWNLGPGINDDLGVAQKAIIGNKSKELAHIILRSFDVCSVCTTH